MEENIPHHLIMKDLAGEATPEESLAVSGWRSADMNNEREFLMIKATWEASFSKEKHFEKEMPDALKTVMADIEHHTTNQPKSIPLQYNFSYWGRIAALLIIIGAAALAYFRFQESAAPSLLEKATAANEKTMLQLADGSQVWLNANSRLKYPKVFEGKVREVILEGEAFFDIAKDPEHPFIIRAQETITKVLGTSFNVRAVAGEKEVSVVVTEGKVAFAAEEGTKKTVNITAW